MAYIFLVTCVCTFSNGKINLITLEKLCNINFAMETRYLCHFSVLKLMRYFFQNIVWIYQYRIEQMLSHTNLVIPSTGLFCPLSFGSVWATSINLLYDPPGGKSRLEIFSTSVRLYRIYNYYAM